MHIISILHANKNLTGGNRYNRWLEDELDQLQGHPIERIAQPFERYNRWSKPFASFGELRLLRKIHAGDWVLLGDFSYLYHLLLLLICRHWKHSYNFIIVHHFAYLEDHGLRRWWREHLLDYYFRQADCLIVPSPYTEQLALQKFGAEKIYHIPSPFKREYHPSNDFHKGEMFFVGSIEHRKGLHFLPPVLEQLKKNGLPDVKMLIAGKTADEYYKQRIIDDARKRGVQEQMIWLGPVDNEQLSALYDHSELFLFPSLLEGYGVVLIEAMQHGLPVVAFNNSAMPFTIRDGENGLLADNENWESLADKVEQLLSNPTLRTHLQQGMEQTILTLKDREDFRRAIKDLYLSRKID